MSSWVLSRTASAQVYPRRRPLPLLKHGRAPRWVNRVRSRVNSKSACFTSRCQPRKRTFRSAFRDTDHSWQVAASEGGTCIRGLRISRPKRFDDCRFSFESADALAFDNEYSGSAVLPALYIAFAERKHGTSLFVNLALWEGTT